MSPDVFPKYLNDPSLLYRISYQELKTLVVQYPYCQNLRYLLLIKSQVENNTDKERNLKMAAAYSLDRTHLHELLKLSYTYAEKDIEFLDLNQNAETDPELDLPILDFTTGINREEKEKVSSTPLPPLEINMDNTPINEKEDLADALEDLFSDDFEDENLVEEKIGFKENIEKEEIIIPTIEEQKEESIVDTQEEKLDVDIKGEAFTLILPLVPPMDVLPKFKAVEQEEEIFALRFPIVPPMDKLPYFSNKIEGQGEAFVLELPLIPPMDKLPRFHSLVQAEPITAATEEIQEEALAASDDEYEGKIHEDDIDLSIKETLDKLIEQQQKEYEDEESLELEIDLAEYKKEKESSEVETKQNKKSGDDGPMPKASFRSWLKQTKAPNPSLLDEINDGDVSNLAIEVANEILTMEEDKEGKEKEKKKKSKKKKTAKRKKEKGKPENKPLMKVVKAKRAEKIKKKKKQEKVRKRKVLELARKSLKENEEIVSETLAKILIEQEKYNKAIKMYRRLSLKFPEKNAYFAAEIEKIEKKK